MRHMNYNKTNTYLKRENFNDSSFPEPDLSRKKSHNKWLYFMLNILHFLIEICWVFLIMPGAFQN